jgi:hypothetical protein
MTMRPTVSEFGRFNGISAEREGLGSYEPAQAACDYASVFSTSLETAFRVSNTPSPVTATASK